MSLFFFGVYMWTKYFIPFKAKPLPVLFLGQAALFVIIWSLVGGTLFPTPLTVMQSFDDLARNHGLIRELLTSATTITQALILSTCIAATISYLASAAIVKPLARSVAALRFLGFAGITFFFTMLSSSGTELKLMLLTFGMTVFQLTNMLAVTESVTQQEVDYARTLNLSHTKTVYHLLIRGRLSDYMDIVRQNAAIGWTLLSMVEGLVRSGGGIGTLLLTQSKYLNLPAILAIQIVILTYGIIQDIILSKLRNVACPYIKYSNIKG